MGKITCFWSRFLEKTGRHRNKDRDKFGTVEWKDELKKERYNRQLTKDVIGALIVVIFSALLVKLFGV